MRLYRYTCGVDDLYGAAEDEQDAYERRSEVDPTYNFLPVTITEVTLPGFEIRVLPAAEDEPLPGDDPPNFDNYDIDQMREWLDSRNVQYHPQLGEKRLRELCKTTYGEEGQ